MRLRGTRSGGGQRDNWLLIKGKDAYADEHGDAALAKYQESVVSGRSMDGITGGKAAPRKKGFSGKPARRKAATKKRPGKSAKRLPPAFIAPQLATLVSAPPEGTSWVHEVKFDGYRLEARLEGGRAALATRNNNDWTARFKGLAEALAEHKKEDIHFYAFDILFLDGEDIRDRPLLQRKALLEKLLKKAPGPIHYSEHFATDGAKFLHQACTSALEGIVSKRADAAYHSGRDGRWLKSKCVKEQELVIGGFTEQPKHPGCLGALLMGYHEKDALIFAGKVGTGFSQAEGRAILKRLRALVQKTSPFKALSAASRRGAVFAKPETVAHVNFAEWTPDGSMRHPSFQGLREDKPAREVVRKQAKAPPIKAAAVSSSKKKHM